MNYIHLYSKKKRISKLINMDYCNAMGIDGDVSSDIYITTKDGKYIICHCQNDENAYDICRKIIEQYIANSIHDSVTVIDLDKIIHELEPTKKENVS